MDNKEIVHAPLAEKNSQNSGKKSNKKRKEKTEKQDKQEEMSQEQIDKMVKEKMNEMNKQSQPISEDPDVKLARKQYKKLLKELQTFQESAQYSDQEKQQKLLEIASRLADAQYKFQEDVVIYSKTFAQENQLVTLQKESANLSDNRTKLELICREIEKKIKEIQEHLNKLPDQEEVNRKNMRDQFNTSVADVREKIKTQDEEAKVFETENEQLREEMKEMCSQYEEREKQFWDIVKQKESDQKNESQKYLKMFEEMQLNAQKSIQQKLQFETQQKLLTQKKLKLSVCKNQFKEFNDTMDKSSTTLIKLKEELVKFALQVKEQEQKHRSVQQRSEQVDAAIVSFMSKNEEVKKNIEQIKRDKEKLKAQILEAQKKLNDRKQQQ